MVVSAKVRYWEDSDINGNPDTEEGDMIPCRNGDYWEPEIDIDTGVIINWEQGKIADIHYKVCDMFSCTIHDADGLRIHDYDGYVPAVMCPEESGYGDYIIMSIDENGKIDGWKFDIECLIEQD